jgi:acyl dehydratase
LEPDVTEKVPAHDDLQPLSATQAAQLEEYLARLEQGHTSMWDIPEGTVVTWEMKITPELVILYADGVEDYNPWYEAWPVGPGESPFGTAIAPPLLVPFWQNWFHRQGMGRSEVGGVAASWRTEFIAPVFIGMTVRYHGKLTNRYIKRGRQYTEREFTIVDVATGQLLVKHTAVALARYTPVDEIEVPSSQPNI